MSKDDEVLTRANEWLDALDPEASPAEDPRALRQIGLAKRDVVAAEGELRQAVNDARDEGYSWSAIGRTLGVTKQAAQSRFGTPART